METNWMSRLFMRLRGSTASVIAKGPTQFLIGNWLQDGSSMATWAARGANVALALKDDDFGFGGTAWRNAVTAAGMKMIIRPDHNSGGPTILADAADPNVLAHMTYDEPEINGITDSVLAAEAAAIRAAGSNKAIAVGFRHNGPGLEQNGYSNYLSTPNIDWEWSDVYSFGGSQDTYWFGDLTSVRGYSDNFSTMVGKSAKTLRLGTYQGNPILYPNRHVFQFLASGRIGESSPGVDKVRPTPTQHRMMFWSSVINGCSGIFYFSHYKAGDPAQISDDTDSTTAAAIADAVAKVAILESQSAGNVLMDVVNGGRRAYTLRPCCKVSGGTAGANYPAYPETSIDGLFVAPTGLEMQAWFEGVEITVGAKQYRLVVNLDTTRSHSLTDSRWGMTSVAFAPGDVKLFDSADMSVDLFSAAVNPTITSGTTKSVAENATLSHALTADQTVTWAITGGADSAKFEISGSTLRWASNGTKDYETPDDAGANNVYDVQVTATNGTSGLSSSAQSIAVTVTDVAEGGGGDFPGAPLSVTTPAVGTSLINTWNLQNTGATGTNGTYSNGSWSGSIDAYLTSKHVIINNPHYLVPTGALWFDTTTYGNMTFSDYDFSGFAGGFEVQGTGTVTFNNCKMGNISGSRNVNGDFEPSTGIDITCNYCTFDGSAGYISGGTIKYDHCRFTNQPDILSSTSFQGITVPHTIFDYCYITGGGCAPASGQHVEFTQSIPDAPGRTGSSTSVTNCMVDISKDGQPSVADWGSAWTAMWSCQNETISFENNIITGILTVNAARYVMPYISTPESFSTTTFTNNCFEDPSTYGFGGYTNGLGTIVNAGGNRNYTNNTVISVL